MKVSKDNPKITNPVIKSPNLFPVVGVGASAGAARLSFLWPQALLP
jgi:hypothetical protein